MDGDESERSTSGSSREKFKYLSESVSSTKEKLQKSRDGFRELSQLAYAPLASSSPMCRSSSDIQNLKAYLAHDDHRRSPPRSEPCSFAANLDKPPSHHEQYSSSSDREEPSVPGILKNKSKSIEFPVTGEGTKGINVFSGGVLIMQNYKEPVSDSEKEKMSDLSSKLIEDCHRLTESLKEIEIKPETKSVQFDIGSDGSAGAQSSISQSPVKDPNGNVADAASRFKEQPSSLSTNDSLSWQPVAPSSPSSTTSGRRLEWDSGADIGYLNVDMSKEKLSTIERVTLKGLDKLGEKDKKVVFRTKRGDRILERVPTKVLELEEKKVETKECGTDPDHASIEEPFNGKARTSDGNTQTSQHFEDVHAVDKVSSDSNKKMNPKSSKHRSRKGSNDGNIAMKDQSTSVNTLGDDFAIIVSRQSESSENQQTRKESPRVKKLKKHRGSPQRSSLVNQRIQQIREIITLGRNSETERRIEEIVIDHSYREIIPEEKPARPTSASSGSNITVLPKVEDKPVQTSERAMESKSVQVSERDNFKLQSSKNIQASGELNSLPKHLDTQMLADMSGHEVRTKSTQFFGAGANSLPKALSKMDNIRVNEVGDVNERKVKGNFESKKKCSPKKVVTKTKPPVSGIKAGKSKPKPTSSGIKEQSSSSDKSITLTVECLRKRDESVDPRIIQKKFFDSQERLMISKGTSMEPQSPIRDRMAQLVSVGIQYSPQEETRGNVSSVHGESQVKDWTDTLDSQASSTQTAHSWVHGGAPKRNSVVRPTRSFEYLPGDVYESSANLREKLPSETSQNVVTESSSSAESEPRSRAVFQSSDFEGAATQPIDGTACAEDESTGTGTVVLEDSSHSNMALHGGAWVLVPDDGANVLELVRKPTVTLEIPAMTSGISGDSGSSRSIRNKHRNPCTVAVQTETIDIRQPNERANETLKRLLRELLCERRQNHSGDVHSLDRMKRPTVLPVKSAGNNSDRSASYYNLPASKNPVDEQSHDFSLTSPPSEEIHPRVSSTPLSSVALEVADSISKSRDGSAAGSITTSDSMSSEISPTQSAQISLNDSGCRVKRSEHRRKKETTRNKDADTQCEHILSTQATQMGDSFRSSCRRCAQCRKEECVCHIPTPRTMAETGTQMSSSREKCLRCRKSNCICSPQDHTETGTQMSWSSEKCEKCGRSVCICYEIRLAEIGTQVSSSLNKCRKCFEVLCTCLAPTEAATQVSDSKRLCKTCKNYTCSCSSKNAKLKESQRSVNFPSDKEFNTFLGVDLSSPELLSSASVNQSSKRATKSSRSDKENASCSVCRCPQGGKQQCIFCACHVDKKSHIPRCDCHEKSFPKFLLPGFCKCHRRNKQYFEGCKCDSDDSRSNNCPCCEYFYQKMRAKIYAAHLEDAPPPVQKKPEPPKPKNYFLKLEETETSKNSTDVSEPEKKPLEVITIKIPVKRLGKLRVPSHRFYYEDGSDQQSSSAKENEVEYLDDIIRKYSRIMSDRKNDKLTGTDEEYRSPSTKRSAEHGGSSYRSLQEWLESNRPDFYNSAESRRRVIIERARERGSNQQYKAQKVVNTCIGQPSKPSCSVPQRIFTTSQLKQQTQKRYKRLSEVTKKKEERKKREEYRTNKIMAEIFAKKLQLKTLRGEVNLSNSMSLLSS